MCIRDRAIAAAVFLARPMGLVTINEGFGKSSEFSQSESVSGDQAALSLSSCITPLGESGASQTPWRTLFAFAIDSACRTRVRRAIG